MKDTRADAKLKNLPAEVLDELWRFRNPEDDGEKLTLVDVLVELKNHHNVEVSISTLSEFYSWLSLKKRMEHAAQRAEQARMEMLKDSSISSVDVERVAQAVFTAEALDTGNVAAYVAVAKLNLARRALDHDERRIEILEKKAAQADAATKVVGNADLSESEKAAKLREIFGA